MWVVVLGMLLIAIVMLTFDDDDYRRLAISSVLVSELSISTSTPNKNSGWF
jgi:hypothetical protein